MERGDRINQNQFFDLITSNELSWQSIIYDLIKTDQLNPWDIDIGILADRYLEVIQMLEEADFFISSKVLLACSLFLRLKSDILANQYIQELNDALYGKKETQTVLGLEDFNIDEDDLPILVLRTPLARHKKVTIDELMKALNHAINTENRRIKKHIKTRQAEKSALMVLPQQHIPLKVRVKKIYDIISDHLSKPENDSIKFHHLAEDKEEKIASFLPILHLANQQKLYLWQPIHFGDIHITAKLHSEELKILNSELEIMNVE